MDICLYESWMKVKMYMHLLGFDEVTGVQDGPLIVQSLYIMELTGKCHCMDGRFVNSCEVVLDSGEAGGPTGGAGPTAHPEIGFKKFSSVKIAPAKGNCNPPPRGPDCEGGDGPTVFYLTDTYYLQGAPFGCSTGSYDILICQGWARCHPEARACYEQHGDSNSANWACMYAKARANDANPEYEGGCGYNEFLEKAFDSATNDGQPEAFICQFHDAVEGSPRDCGGSVDMQAGNIATRVIQAKYLKQIEYERTKQSRVGKGLDILFSRAYNDNNA